jgi:hypothetical protein
MVLRRHWLGLESLGLDVLVSCGTASSPEPCVWLELWKEPSVRDRMNCRVIRREVGCMQMGSAVCRWSGSFEVTA